MSEFAIILIYVLGLALMVAEIFLVGVVLGLAGLCCVLAAIYFGFQRDSTLGWTLIVITAVSIPVLIILWTKVLNRVFAMKFTQSGYTSADEQEKTLLGKEGVAVTTLRPAGMARFADKKVDVVSEGDIIERDARIRVVEVSGNRVVVRAIKS